MLDSLIYQMKKKKHNKYIFTQLKHVEQIVELFLLTFTNVVNKLNEIHKITHINFFSK